MADIMETIAKAQANHDFSGTVFVQDDTNTIVDLSYGYANRSEQLRNHTLTRFGIASGCKIFTAVAVCQLVDSGKLSFDSRLKDCVDFVFPMFDEEVTIHHLLSHTSGIPDYYDEENLDNFEDLWRDTPMYQMRNLIDFLPLFQDKPMKCAVGSRFGYNNAGYVLLGLIVEAISQLTFVDYVQANVFNRAGMSESGYFELDALPQDTALGYIDDPDGAWRTNIYSLPVKGGSDGGAFVTARDMVQFWDALVDNKLLSPEMTQTLLSDHVRVNDDDDYYGYGVWILKRGDAIVKYHVMGYDPGVSFHSAYYPGKSIKAVVCSNKSHGAANIMGCIEDRILT